MHMHQIISKGGKCNDNFYQTAGFCIKLPANAFAHSGLGFICKPGYKKNDNECTPRKEVPVNAYKSANSQGWKCKF